MLAKTNRRSFLKRYPYFIHGYPRIDKYIIPDIYDRYILRVEAASTKGLSYAVSREFALLMSRLNFSGLYFLGDTTIPWLYRDHDYAPVKRALDYLKINNISKSFNGAIWVETAQLTEFMRNLFWLVRCNGIVTYVHFADEGFNISGSICKYGNIHLSTVNKQTDIAFRAVLNTTTFEKVEGNNCGGGPIYQRRSTYEP